MKASYLMQTLHTEFKEQSAKLRAMVTECELQHMVAKETEERILKLGPILANGDRELTDAELETLGYVR